MNFNLDNYEPVDARLKAFYAKYPNGLIDVVLVTPVEQILSHVLFKATIWKEKPTHSALYDSVGYAFEKAGSQGASKYAWTENAQTSAIGRALAHLGFFSNRSLASKEEIEKVQAAEISETLKKENVNDKLDTKTIEAHMAIESKWLDWIMQFCEAYKPEIAKINDIKEKEKFLKKCLKVSDGVDTMTPDEKKYIWKEIERSLLS